MQILEGKPVAEKLIENIKASIFEEDFKPRLDIFLIGDNPSSIKYVDLKMRKAQEVGIETVLHKYSEDIDEISLLTEIDDLNNSPQINGIMVQLPLPKKFNTPQILNKISIEKDVDGLSDRNYIKSATANAVIRILDFYDIPVTGKNVVVVGSSVTVGIPTAELLINRGATVTVCNDQTQNIDEKIKEGDIVISATGVPGIISANNIKQDAVVIDVGFTLVEGQVLGDVNTQGIENVAGALSPVPGGVGPVTVASLLYNTLVAWKVQNNV